MTKMIPAQISASESSGERRVFTALEGITNRPDWVTIHSLKQSQVFAGTEAETDFVVFVPGRGIVVVEAKGATAATVNGDEWLFEGVANAARKKNPFTQINNATRNIRAFLKSNGYSPDTIPMARLVWLTKLNPGGFAQSNSGTTFSPSELAFQQDLSKPVAAIERALNEHISRFEANETVRYEPEGLTVELTEAMVESLRPSLKTRMTAAERSVEQRFATARATEEQLLILDIVKRNNLIYFEGPAGTGKTQMLSHAAMQMKKEGRRVLYVCYNEMLADKLNLDIGKVEGITVLSLNQLLLSIVGLKQNPKNATTEWFDVELPARALEAVAHGKTGLEFEAVCIDEFQDIAVRIDALNATLGVLTNRLRPFKVMLAGDDDQQIHSSGTHVDSYAVAKSILPNLTHVTLNTNCRQPPALSKAIHSLLSWPQANLRHRLTDELPGQLDVYSTSEANQAKDLAKVVKQLLNEYAPEQIRILSVFGYQSSTVAKLFQEGETHSKELRELKALLKHPTAKTGSIHWRSISKYKGLEDDVVILTDVSKAAADYLAKRHQSIDNQVYVGLTRARTHAVLFAQDGLYAKAARKIG